MQEFPAHAHILKNLSQRVKRIYWFNPEPKEQWHTGDSEILYYQKYCSRVFECCNLNQLAQAISEIT